MKDWEVEEPPYPRENYVHHNAITKMALVDHWVFSLWIHPQNGTVGDTSLFMDRLIVYVHSMYRFSLRYSNSFNKKNKIYVLKSFKHTFWLFLASCPGKFCRAIIQYTSNKEYFVCPINRRFKRKPHFILPAFLSTTQAVSYF